MQKCFQPFKKSWGNMGIHESMHGHIFFPSTRAGKCYNSSSSSSLFNPFFCSDPTFDSKIHSSYSFLFLSRSFIHTHTHTHTPYRSNFDSIESNSIRSIRSDSMTPFCFESIMIRSNQPAHRFVSPTQSNSIRFDSIQSNSMQSIVVCQTKSSTIG